MKLVYMESPYAGDVEVNVAYAKSCALDCLRRGEAPFISHLLYTQVLDDLVPEERTLGMESGFAWAKAAVSSVVYIDRGISGGMQAGIDRATSEGRPVEFRRLVGWGYEHGQ